MKNTLIIISIIVVSGAVILWFTKPQQEVVHQQPSESMPSTTTIYSGQGFQVTYPKEYTIDTAYTYEGSGPGKEIKGVAFTIPKQETAGNNLGEDSKISIETMPETTICSAANFLQEGTVAASRNDAGTDYTYAETADAGAGNRYEERVYALNRNKKCYGIRYFIHYGAIENYPATIHSFDKAALLSDFDDIRRSIVFTE